METGKSPSLVVNKATPTPKAIINQKYGNEACYSIEEVQESVQNGCPGLAIPQQRPCLFRCCLQLPEFSITSEPFTRKKDAEQSAAKMALEKLGVQPSTNSLTILEAWDELISRVSFLFSNEFLSSSHPLTCHFREALEREGDLHGLVPIPILAACDLKLTNLCKAIDHEAEANISLNISFIVRAARLSGLVATSETKHWIWRKDPYPIQTIQKLINSKSDSKDGIWIEAVVIPCSMGKPVEQVDLNVPSDGYYMDVIAEKLGVTDASHVLVSRSIGKASSEMRLYFSVSSDLSNAKETTNLETTLNKRASYFCGQNIYGDAILANIGYRWKSTDLFHEVVSLGTYYRILVGRLPDGGYKLSREAILAGELPVSFTARSNWRGPLPRDLLYTFCRLNWLSEPEFSVISIDNFMDSPSEISDTRKTLKVSKPAKETEYATGGTSVTNSGESAGLGGTFRCKIKILSKGQDLIIECTPEDSYRKQNNAIQNTALKVLSWLNKYFKNLDMPIEKLSSSQDIHVHSQNFSKELALCLSIHNFQKNGVFRRCRSLGSNCEKQPNITKQQELRFLNIEGPDSGISPCNGSLICISYAISLVKEGEHMKEPLESRDEFEFEIGIGAVIPELEVCVTQMALNQSARFITELPSHDLIFAANADSAKSLSLSEAFYLEYSINLLRVAEPMEERMEQALFSPPLSKQRVEYALRHINESHATTLVDFGCGSGSLLDSLLDYPTTLEKIVGVDISRKSLGHAAKVLHSKLMANSDPVMSRPNLKSVVLYDGSITVFDSRLYGFDIGTCLEVIEHMEEDQAYLFGDVVLSSFCPHILIVSTPNYEYNPILQRNNNREDDGDDKTNSLPCKFRNHDHKFEWTREQFSCWASDLAAKHNYSVEFSGVGGSGDLEPGFASQIAIFKKGQVCPADECSINGDLAHHCEVIWEWSNTATPTQL